MLWYRFNRFDRILIIFSAIGLVLSVIFFFEDRWIYKLLANKAQQLEKIGVVKTAVNDVRQRHADAFSWLPLETDTEVYQGDSIFTSSRSEAVIITDRGERISISPNSLVVINAQTDSIRLDIDYGSVLGQVGKDKKLLISSGGDVTEFKGDDAVVKVDVNKDKNLVVNVIEGQVEVSSDEGRHTLGPKENAQISESGAIVDPRDVHIELLTPVAERILKPDESHELVLTWRSSYQFSEYTVEIAHDANFTKMILKEKTNLQIYRPPTLPTNERLFWRISANLKPNQTSTKSGTAGFTLAEDKPPVISFPRDNMRLSFEEQPTDAGRSLNVTLRWLPRSVSARWEVQLASSPDFNQNLKIFESKENFVDLGALTEDNYYVRVRAKDWVDAIWGETLSFTVLRKSPATLRPPQVLTAEEEFMLVTKLAGYSPLELSTAPQDKLYPYVEAIPELAWNSIAGATSYEIEIATDPRFTQIIQKSETPTSRFSWNGVRIGNFYWRIRSVSNGNRRGPFTEAQTLKVRLAPPSSLTKDKVVEEVTALTEMDSAPAPFLLRWSPTLLTARYEVEFDKDQKFQKALKVITNNPFKKVQAPVAGLYFWRVRSLDQTGKPLTNWSETLRYDYTRVYLSPETTKELKALYPNNETIMLIGRGDIKINFRWVTPIKNSKHRFQMSNTADFSQKRLDFITDKDFFLFREELPDGWFYWRLRVENEQFTSPWTAAYQFQIQHEETSFNFERSEKNKEQEIKLFEEKRAQEFTAAQKENKIKNAELARLEIESLPQLETPSDLMFSESLGLETRPIIQRDLEQIPDHQQYALLKDLPLFEWLPISGALEYHLEISENVSFTKIIDSTRISRPNYRWLQARPGRFFWRVRAMARGHRDSLFSEPSPIEVTVQPPKLSTPHALMVATPNENPIVLLKWSSVPFAHSYQVEWSSDQEFNKKVSRTTTSARLNQPVTQEGLYFWRVRPLNSSQQPLTDFNEPRPLNISFITHPSAPVKTPILLYPIEQQALQIPNGDTPRISFSWHAPTIKGQFILEIARDKDFNDVLQRLNTKGNIVIADAPVTNKSELFWRLAVSSAGKVVWRSPSRQIKFLTLPLRQPAAAQKIPTKTLPARAK